MQLCAQQPEAVGLAGLVRLARQTQDIAGRWAASHKPRDRAISSGRLSWTLTQYRRPPGLVGTDECLFGAPAELSR